MSFIKRDNGIEGKDLDSLEKTRLALAKTETLYRVAQSLIISSNLQELLQAVVNIIAETLPANRVTLVTFNIETHQISHFVKGGLGINDVINVTFDELWDGLTGWTLREWKPVLSPKLIPDMRESVAVQRRRQETNCGAIIVVPLHYQNTILGTITAINCPDESDFTNRDVELMMAIANQSAIAIAHALLIKKLQSTNTELELRVLERTTELTETNAQLQLEITERKQAEEERRSHLWFLESMDQVNRAIQGANDLEQMTSGVLDAALTIFACDRAWLGNPCDPDAPTWQVLMERSRPEYPSVLPIGVELPLDQISSAVFRILRNSLVPVQFGSGTAQAVPIGKAEGFSVKSFIATAIYPKIGKPWAFGLHQCAYARIWTSAEERLFQEISRRLSDALTSLIAFRNLQASERKLIDAQRLAHVGHWDWDAVDSVLKWSDETYRIFGLEPGLESITLQRLSELIHPDDFEAVSKAIIDAEADIKPYDIEYRIVRPDGTIRYIYNSGEVIFDQNKKPLGMFGTLIDVTERRQMEDVLRKSEKKYRSLIQKVQTAIVLHDGQGRILDSNPLARYLLNLSENQLLGKDLDEPIWHFLRENGTDMPVSEYPVSLVRSSRQPLRDYVVGIQHAKANETVWALVNAEPEHDDGGEIVRIIVSFVEITERKRYEAALQRYNRRLSILRDIDHQILFASSPLSIANVVLKLLAELTPCEFLSVILHNKVITEERIFALRHTPDIGVYAQETQPVVQNEVLEKLKSGKTAIAADLRMQAGQHAHLAEELESHGVRSALASPMMVQGRLIGTIALASLQVGFFTSEHQQITEEVSAQVAIALHQAELNDEITRYNTELEQRVNERTTQLQSANEELELFSYSVSHDLRAPLRAIQGFAEIIARRHKAALNEEGRHYFDNIVTASEQMDELITDLLDYARLGQRHVDLEVVSIAEVLNEVVENLALEIEKTNGQIHYSGDLPYVLGDKSLLRRIFTNLVENALIYHAVSTPPIIDVLSEVETDYAVIHLADNGIGIAPEFSEKIFNIFQRLHNNNQYPGTGIGLAIVRKSVEMLNGFVWVESSGKDGSVFCVKLPCKAEKRK